jgi:signal transduction histidine kinase
VAKDLDRQDLAALIGQQREVLLDAWLERILAHPTSHYRDRPADEVRSWLANGIDTVLSSLYTGSEQPLQAHAAAVGSSRQQLGFRIDEVVDALLQLKEVLFAQVVEQWHHTPNRCAEACRVLDGTLRSLVACFTEVFARSMREQEHQISVLAERQRLARDLHDAVSQSLYAAHLHAEAATRLLRANELAGVDENLELLRDAARRALADMRLLIFELRPSSLPDEGLVEALRSRLEAVERRSGIRTSFEADADLDLSTAQEEALFGIATEALNNSLKHAGADTIVCSLKSDSRYVVLQVSDDGQGFELDGAGGGFGLEGMRERAADIGAELIVNSAPGSGTDLLARIPLAGQPGDAHD